MAYTTKNYKNTKELKADFLAGKTIRVIQPGGLFPLAPGSVTLEGPHYPQPHKWYTRCYHDDGLLITLELPGCKVENTRRKDAWLVHLRELDAALLAT